MKCCSVSGTVEEAYLLCSYLKDLSPESVLAIGPVPTKGKDLTFKPDQTAGRTGSDTSFVVPRPFTIRMPRSAPTVRGVEAILAHFQGSVISFRAIAKRAGAGEFSTLYSSRRTRSTTWESEAEASKSVEG